MRWNLWLAQPETERSLGAILRIAVAVVVLWTLAAAYGMWSARATLAAARASILSQSNQITQITRDLPEKRRLARKADGVQVVSSQGAGSAEITGELADLAHMAGAEIQGVRIGDSGTAGQAAPAGATGTDANGSPSATPAATGQASASADDGWSHESFECNIAGEYPALTRFLDGLAASRHVLDFTSLQITQGDGKGRPETPRLEMKIGGAVYETSEKS